ncbi:hypothetical protein SK128_021843 [Halocaridina rubra]|uniref:Uncharacterized protein n=1 Tax=Halocaridina rubra TaxID=373956 RepID=A0AAN8X9I6_HALRR
MKQMCLGSLPFLGPRLEADRIIGSENMMGPSSGEEKVSKRWVIAQKGVIRVIIANAGGVADKTVSLME